MNKAIPFIIAIVAITIVIMVYRNTESLTHNLYDDSYISMRYAVNLAEGRGLVFNEGDTRTDAASSFLYTVVLALFYRIGISDLEFVSFALNMASLGLIAAFVYLSGIGLGVNIVIAAMTALIASTHGFISGFAVLGMDTVPFTALLVMWAYFTFINRRENLSALFTVLVVFMRFEGLLVLPFWCIEMRADKSQKENII